MGLQTGQAVGQSSSSAVIATPNNAVGHSETAEATMSVLVDVREPAEFAEGHIPGSLNFPSSQSDFQAYEPYADRHIQLVCESGNRAKDVAKALEVRGFTSVSVSPMSVGLVRRFEATDEKVTGWDIDRQLRFTLGIFLLIGMIGYLSGVTEFLVLVAIIAVGLTFTSLIDRCYLRMLIARMPWNRLRQ